MLLALGPWDVYQDDSGDWHARNLLRPDGAVANITDLGDFRDGRSDHVRAIEVTGSTEIDIYDIALTFPGPPNVVTIRIVAQMPYDHDSGDWPNTHNYLCDARYTSDDYRIGLYYDTADDKFKVFINGADRLESAAQTFDAGDWCEIVVVLNFDDDNYVLYIDGLEVDTDSTSLTVPYAINWKIGTDYNGSNGGDFVIQEYQIFFVELSAAAVSGINGRDLRARWMDVLCEVAQPWAPDGTPGDRGVVASLVADGDARWRSRDGDVHVWDITSGADDETVTVDSDDDVYPVLRLTPKQAKTAGYAYRRWVPVIWTVDAAYSKYPYMLGTFDTAALVTASKAQADGDDWRVVVDGSETDRWFGDSGTAQFNQTATKTWVNLDFQAGWEGTLEAAIGSGDTVDSIDVNEDISGAASSGILVAYHGASYEAFTYTGKNETERRFTGVSRAARGTSALALSADDSVYWVQHDVWVLYGNASATAPSQDDDYKPIFDLGDSTNTSWVYEEFGEDDGLRTGAWTEYGDTYTGNRGVNANPWIEIGVDGGDQQSNRMKLYNPCGITNGSFTNGEKWVDAEDPGSSRVGVVQSSQNGSTWTDEYNVPEPASTETWEAWSRNEALASGARYLSLMGDWDSGADYDETYLEASDCTVTLDSSNTPTHEIGNEQGNYTLDCVIENTA
ncbi:MAG: hypothetical protein DRI81_20470, partial [Chloroflexi bacterium]